MMITNFSSSMYDAQPRLSKRQIKLEQMSEKFQIPSSERIKNSLVSQKSELMHLQESSSPKSRKGSSKKSAIKQANVKEKNYTDETDSVKTSEREISPGYYYREKKDRIQVVLTEKFWGESKVHSRTSSRCSFSASGAVKTNNSEVSTVNKDLILPLERKIGELTLEIQQQRADHEDDVDTIRNEHAAVLKKRDEQNNEQLLILQERHVTNLESLKVEHQQKMDDLLYEKNREVVKLQDEIKFVKDQFDVHTKFIEKEMDRKWQAQKLDFEQEMELKIKKLLNEQKTELLKDKEISLDKLVVQNDKYIKSLEEKHQKEMDKLLKKYANSIRDKERLQQTLTENNILKEENRAFKEDLQDARQKLQKLENELSDTKMQLGGYQNNFFDKVAEVEEEFIRKTNNLILENSELRKMHLRKCEELYVLNHQLEMKKAEGESKDVKDMSESNMLSKILQMEGMRNTFNDVKKNRPVSAPGTLREQHKVRRTLAAKNTAVK